jgi:aspartyl/glutamyl-tRNA(Asn/Gln) amidotransferase C subunit
MTQQIDPDTFAHLVDLASFEFEPEQADYLRQQLNNQLKAIQELTSIPLDESVPVSLHGVPYPVEISQALRQDVPSPFADGEALTAQMPQFEDGYVIVPDIPHQTLD